jgi:hypothetical protein
MPPAGLPRTRTLLRALVANRGRLWPAGRDVVRAYPAGPDELVAGLRRNAASRTRPVFVLAENILPDLVIHGQDIAVALGLDRPIPAATGRVALGRIWTMGWPFHASRRFQGLHVHADDCGWSAGAGPDVAGSTAHLLLAMTGRDVDVQLQGSGAGIVAQRLARRHPADSS